jgi:hypothetical protein
MLSNEQKQQISALGMPLQTVEEQLQNFKQGFPFLEIQDAAKIGDGIQVLTEEELTTAVNEYESVAPTQALVKFVPASGAASRMFKNLFGFLEKGTDSLEDDAFVRQFFASIDSFAFYEDLNRELQKCGNDLPTALNQKEYARILTVLLEDEGLGYGNLPKGLLKFHAYGSENRTPVEEHFVEGAQYGVGKDRTVRLHFTVSPEHQKKFEEKVAEVRPAMEKRFGVTFSVDFSQQKKTTDTIAVDLDNEPFVEDNGDLLFRPAGHGALLANLNEIDADLVFIKNIDNVVPDRLKETTTTYKKAIGGLLLRAQSEAFQALKALDKAVSEATVENARQVFTQTLGGKLPDAFQTLTLDEQGSFLHNKLNRPIRVCGMVENTGEPGGGPFWVKESDGSLSLQIAETAQLDLDDPDQKAIFQAATHFNPTDLVCGIKDYRGKPFDLMAYRDPKTGFITQKSKSGRDLKAQELPGLWNGSMAHWNSLFVEVPLITFNPVKTINDLLREVHQ